MKLRLFFCILVMPISILLGNNDFLYTSFARIEAFPDVLNEKKVRVVGVLAHFVSNGEKHIYLYGSLDKFERRVSGERIRLYLDKDMKIDFSDSLEVLNGRFVEVWGEYLGPDGIEDRSFTGGYLGTMKNVIRIDLAED